MPEAANTQTYLRDVYDHTVQIIDIVETYREFASGPTAARHMSAILELACSRWLHEGSYHHDDDLYAANPFLPASTG